MGAPLISRSIFRGRRVDASRAGMMAIAFTQLVCWLGTGSGKPEDGLGLLGTGQDFEN
jgi:hypothetical protein